MRFLGLLILSAAHLTAAASIPLALSSRTIGCSAANKIEMTAGPVQALTREDGLRMFALWRWFHDAGSFKPSSLFQFTVRAAGEAPITIPIESYRILGGGIEDWTPDPRKPEAFQHVPDTLRVCLTLDRDLPAGILDATLQFVAAAHPSGQLPDDLKTLVNHSLNGPMLPVAPTAPAKSFVRELDFAAMLLSSVTDKTSGGRTVRDRDTKATFDLWLAPILRLPRLSLQPGHNWFTYFTPIAVEAHASTQNINRDSLSQNRIVMGPEYEFRYYLKNSQGAPSDNVLRFTLMFKNASDRDFKLNEPKFIAEFRPVWGRANHDVLDPKLIRGIPNFRLTLGEKIGRKFAPIFGFEQGSMFLRGIPASSLRANGAFTRGYAGLEAGLDFNRKLSLNTTQILYIRGELDNDSVHYMKNTAQWTLLGATPQFLSQLQFTFEKGSLPPFRSTVNAYSLGIRVISSNWGISR